MTIIWNANVWHRAPKISLKARAPISEHGFIVLKHISTDLRLQLRGHKQPKTHVVHEGDVLFDGELVLLLRKAGVSSKDSTCKKINFQIWRVSQSGCKHQESKQVTWDMTECQQAGIQKQHTHSQLNASKLASRNMTHTHTLATECQQAGIQNAHTQTHTHAHSQLNASKLASRDNPHTTECQLAGIQNQHLQHMGLHFVHFRFLSGQVEVQVDTVKIV